MQTVQSQKSIMRVLSGQSCHPPPIWLMRQAGRYLPEYRQLRLQEPDFLNFCFSPDRVVEATLQPITRFDFDGAIIFSDILVIPKALGQDISFTPGPVLKPIKRVEDLPVAGPDDWLECLDPVYQALSCVRRILPQNKALFGFCGAPWTLACYMIDGGTGTGFPLTRNLSHVQPEEFGKIIDLLCQIIVFHLDEQIKAGADCVQLFDSWAGILPQASCHRWCIQPVARIIKALKACHPSIPVIAFPRGIGPLCADYVTHTHIDALSVDHTLSCRWIGETLQTLCPVQGNIDPDVLAAGGDRLNRAVDHLMAELSKGPFIVNLGHGVLPHTNPDHVWQLVERVRRFSA